MALREDLLPVFEGARGLIDALGLRTSRVLLRTKTWSAGEVGLGVLTITDVELSPRPKVREKGPGVVEVGPITPQHTAGGYSLASLTPSLLANKDFLWVVIGPDGVEREYRWADTDTRRAFRYMFTLESLDRSDPQT